MTLNTCDNCLTACGEKDDVCHYCGNPRPYDGDIIPDRPRTVGQEMAFATVLHDLKNEPEIEIIPGGPGSIIRFKSKH